MNSKSKNNKFKRTVYWNEYKSKIETITQAHNDNNYKRTLLDVATPGVNRLFVAGFNYNITDGDDDDDDNDDDDGGGPAPDVNRLERNSQTKNVLPRADIKDYNVLIYGRNFYDQNISEDFRKADWKK